MAAIDESFIKLFGNSQNTYSPINTGASRGSSDVVTATFNPRGASHVAVENQKIAAQQKIADDENRRQAELAQQEDLKKQQAALDAQNAEIAKQQTAWDAQAAAAPAPTAPGPDPYASFYSLNPKQQQKAQRNPGVAQRRYGITIPPAGYTPAQQPVAAAATARPARAARPETQSALPSAPTPEGGTRALTLEEWNVQSGYEPNQSLYISYTPDGGGQAFTSPYLDYTNQFNQQGWEEYEEPDTSYVSQSYDNLMGTSGFGAVPA